MKKKDKEIIIERKTFNIYGIKNDPTSHNLIELLDHHELDYIFFDMRDFPPTDDQLRRWADFEGEEYPINGRNTIFKKKERFFLQLDEAARRDWLREHYHVISRPIVELKDEEVISIGGRPERVFKTIAQYL